MKLTLEEVQKLARLSRLKLSPEEQERLSGQLSDILTYVDMLSEVDTSGVKETCQVTGLMNVLVEDEIDERFSDADALLEQSPLPKKDHQIQIKRMM